MFRPQAASLAPPGRSAGVGNVAIHGRMAHREFLGSTMRYGIRVGTTEVLVDAAFTPDQPLHEVGEHVAVSVRPHALQWLSD